MDFLSRTFGRIWWWGPAVGLMSAIFVASSRDAPDIVKVYYFPHQDKVFHAFAYFVLAVLVLRGLSLPSGRITRRNLVLAVVITSLYGASDELHQSFVPTRHACVWDWVADTLGGMFVFLVPNTLGHLFQLERRLLPEIFFKSNPPQ